MFKDLKIKTKISLTVCIMAAITVFLSFAAYINIAGFNDTIETLSETSEFKRALYSEQKAFWLLLAGDSTGSAVYAKAREEIEGLAEKKDEHMSDLIRREEEIHKMVLTGDRDFFSRFNEAHDGFIEKNNKHIIRLSGYINAWTSPGSSKNIKALNILEKIRQERILMETFDPKSENREIQIQQFRKINDDAVEELVELWIMEIDQGITGAQTSDMRRKLNTMQRIVGDITATSFPAVTEEDAELLGVSVKHIISVGSDADTATKELYNNCAESVSAYEDAGWNALWRRADIPEVGDEVTPIFALGKIVSCQQGLRVNAEELFVLYKKHADEIDPTLASLSSEVENFQRVQAENASTSGRNTQILFIVLAFISVAGALLIGFVISVSFVRRIVRNKTAAVEIAKGNMDVELNIDGEDEIDEVGRALVKMRDSLKVVFEEYEKKIK